MFRRKEEGFEDEMQGDILADEADEIIDTGANDAAMAEEEEVVATTAAAVATPKPAPAAAFRPQAAPNIAANRNVAPAEPRSSAPVSANPKASKRVLTVGHDIHMKGEISTCDRLVIEGSVDASLKDVHTVELAQTGSFKGSAEIEDAEISGSFEGDLVVKGRLIIYATGKVTGNISYGEIEIERGGQLSGTITTVAGMQSAAGAKKAA